MHNTSSATVDGSDENSKNIGYRFAAREKVPDGSTVILGRGVVVRERGMERRSGTYFGAGTALRQMANIVDHRWNANTEAFRQITSYSLG